MASVASKVMAMKRASITGGAARSFRAAVTASGEGEPNRSRAAKIATATSAASLTIDSRAMAWIRPRLCSVRSGRRAPNRMVNPARMQAMTLTVSCSDPATGVPAVTSCQAMDSDFSCSAI